MNEMTRTLTYVGVALLVLLSAVLTRPTPPKLDANSQATDTINEVADPLSATELEIVKYDEADSSSSDFKVAKEGGRWVIPSYENYPADAEQQMGSAAVSVMNLKVLDMVSANPGEHKTYGVVEPKDDLPEGAVGVGMRVTMKDDKETLVDMVVGKEVKDQPGLRYVRPLGRDNVFMVKLDTSKLTTKFEDWIEKDLLKLNPADIAEVRLNDYSLEYRQHPSGGLALVRDLRSEIALDYLSDKSEWKLDSLEVFDPAAREKVKVELAEDEQLDQVKLNDMKSALGDLKIVSVERKPEGIEPDLKATKAFLSNQDAQQNLQERGFFPYEQRKGFVEILSKEGEINCQMKDGVEYILRFGQPLLGSQGNGDAEESKDASSKGRNRYLFVMVKLNESAIPKPDLAELPDADAPAEAKSEEPAADEAPKSDEPKSDEPKAEESKSKESDAEEGADDAGDELTEEQEADDEQSDKEKKDDAKKDEAAKDAPAKDANAAGDEKAAEDKKESSDTPKAQPKLDKKTLEAALEVLEKENKKKQEEYETKLKAAQTRVTELNERFGDWYYVISDDVYKKIHLGRNDISKKKEAPKGEGTGLDTPKDLEHGFPGLPGLPAAPKK